MNQTKDAYVCARCAAVGATCCRLNPGQEDICFPVSELERQRIVEYGPRLGGLTGAPNSKSFLDNLRRLFPGDRALVTRRFPPHGEHLRLATRPDGACAFLAPDGCVLPREARPYYCRLFPFWISAGAVTAFEARGCLACTEARTVAGMLELLGMTPANVRELHGRLRLAWGLVPGGPEEPLPAKVENNA
ncbi:hypothetical protein NNJEOMEG_02819 [Fundidesulfovibrio magnetotacticus]|uniref:Uncharacterized protein n=1 Tax=Fundidesulfovibrio magnetotacticus TaxID=2730080 RepID=A0A6V8LWI9_9BACT|nr:zinc/iron-chelating domain-containing protein [Fundidesulfovibrio magnetotacticus]GFK94971.1 hypothetical protein NNJEOMEG_02819 [Fundidesulfovibrio magnetotacticus]